MKILAGRSDSTSFVNSYDLIIFHVLVIIMHDFPIQHHPEVMLSTLSGCMFWRFLFRFADALKPLLASEQCKIVLLTHRLNIVSNEYCLDNARTCIH